VLRSGKALSLGADPTDPKLRHRIAKEPMGCEKIDELSVWIADLI
jgi:hypothetical protein